MKKIARFRVTADWNANQSMELPINPVQTKPVDPVQADPVDRLSELPDALIRHILSFLSLNEAAGTSVLARRWRCLWFDVPKLEFWGLHNENVDRFVDWVDRVISVRTVNCVEKFWIDMMYNKRCESHLNAWIEYAIKSKVKELGLQIFPLTNHGYRVPESVYSCSSLKSLLIGNSIVLARKIEWEALTKLCLEDLELGQGLVDKILAGCPVLYKLELHRCFGFEKLEISSRCLQTLLVDNGEWPDRPALQISAPFLHTLKLLFFPDGRWVKFGDVQALHTACIEFNENNWHPNSREVMELASVVLEVLDHVTELKVGSDFFEVITMLAVGRAPFTLSKRRRLEVTSSPYIMYNFSGIMALLNSSPYLETLVIDGCETDGMDDTAPKEDLDGDLSHLKTINITNFADFNGEPVLTLARILLKRAPVLEKMEVVIDCVDISDFIRIREELLRYPRTSRKAVVVVSGKAARVPFSKLA